MARGSKGGGSSDEEPLQNPTPTKIKTAPAAGIDDDEAVTFFEGKPYSLAGFEARHPGGRDLLRLAYGRDATAMIHSYHPNVDKVRAILKKRAVTSDVGTDVAPLAPHFDRDVRFDSAFYKELKAVVNDYFLRSGKRRRGGLMAKTLVLLAAVVFVYYIALYKTWLAAPLLGVLLSMIGLCIQHDANHGAFSEQPWINELMGHLDDLIGGSALTWRHQHSVGHHVHCNDTHGDEDTKVGIPLIRFNPDMPHWAHMRYQHFYLPLVLAFIGVVSPLLDVVDYLKGAHGDIQFHSLRMRDRFAFWSLKALYFVVHIGLPYYVQGAPFLWQFYLPYQLVGGVFLALQFAASHNNELVEYNVRDSDDFAEIQFRSSANWASDSIFWNYLSGGLNCQIEHHMFPGVAHIHYPALVPLVRKVAKKHSVPYNEFPTFRANVASLFRQMCELAKPPAKQKQK